MKLVLSLAVFVCGVLLGACTTGRMGNNGFTSTTASPKKLRGGMSTTVPPEIDPSKYDEQNATKVVEMNATQWVKWRTYNVTDVFSNNPLECESFNITKTRIPNNYSLQYTYRSGFNWTTMNETLILKDFGLHHFRNDMYFQRTPVGIATDNFVLYSNYVNCTVLRITMTGQGEGHCDLWMANLTLSQETPDDCLNRFFEYCNTTHIYRVYYPNCTNKYIHFSLK
uniref:Putative salivary lipocalin n=1 Tax=Ixodes ricinus TaxID=34613 RepID=A0A0K8R7P5_IXORI